MSPVDVLCQVSLERSWNLERFVAAVVALIVREIASEIISIAKHQTDFINGVRQVVFDLFRFFPRIFAQLLQFYFGFNWQVEQAVELLQDVVARAADVLW